MNYVRNVPIYTPSRYSSNSDDFPIFFLRDQTFFKDIPSKSFRLYQCYILEDNLSESRGRLDVYDDQFIVTNHWFAILFVQVHTIWLSNGALLHRQRPILLSGRRILYYNERSLGIRNKQKRLDSEGFIWELFFIHLLMSNIHVAFVNGERYCWYLLLNTNKDFSIIFVHCGSAINFNTDHIGNVSKITNCFVNIIIHGKRGIRPSGWSSKNSRTNNWVV